MSEKNKKYAFSLTERNKMKVSKKGEIDFDKLVKIT